MGAGFGWAARRYWLGVFPAVAREVARREELAAAIPDPTLRHLALRSLERKRGNLEGAAAFELLAGRHSDGPLLRALTACQTMCDYLDLVAEQRAGDPVANGRRLHEALIVAVCPGEPHCDYYALGAHGEDGGYLKVLVGDVRRGLAGLPGLPCVAERLHGAAERVALYQSYNHGDAYGSYKPFRRWAAAQRMPSFAGLRWWELGGGAGSTLCLLALLASAADARMHSEAAAAIERAYFPWIGALHSLLDSLADLDEDEFGGERGLIGCYASAEHAAARMQAIASEALRHAASLPAGRRHVLIFIAMTAFYLCDAKRSASPYARAVLPALRRAAGPLVSPATWMMAARRAAQSPPQLAELDSPLCVPCTVRNAA